MSQKILCRVKSRTHREGMSNPYFPNINLGAVASFATMRQQLELHPTYFDDVSCPYDDDTREQLKRIFAPKVVEVPVPGPERIVEKRVEVAAQAAEGGGKRGPKAKSGSVDIDEIATEISEIRQELRQLKIDGKSLQTQDRLAIIKTRAALVEKMISMAERTQNVKKLSLFQSVVMGILDDLTDATAKQEFMKRIEPYAATEI